MGNQKNAANVHILLMSAKKIVHPMVKEQVIVKRLYEPQYSSECETGANEQRCCVHVY